MKVDVVQLPRLLEPAQLAGRAVVVFDVLRATTTMTAALEAGVAEIRVFDSVEGVRSTASEFAGRKLLIGEVNTLPPEGFDLGNSPGALDMTKHAGMTVFMSTTNGTKALVAAKSAPVVLAGCLLNAFAAAKKLREIGRDVTLLCSGSGGEFSDEDQIGAGAVIASLQRLTTVELLSPVATAALKQFADSADNLRGVLRETIGGHNIRRVGLDEDIDFAARLDVMSTVGRLMNDPLRIVAE